MEHAWTYRHYSCCLERALLWFKRLAVDARAAGTSTEPSPDFSSATYYRVARVDLRPTDPGVNWFAVTAWQRSQLGVGGTAARR
jgi:hypothetical protein